MCDVHLTEEQFQQLFPLASRITKNTWWIPDLRVSLSVLICLWAGGDPLRAERRLAVRMEDEEKKGSRKQLSPAFLFLLNCLEMCLHDKGKLKTVMYSSPELFYVAVEREIVLWTTIFSLVSVCVRESCNSQRACASPEFALGLAVHRSPITKCATDHLIMSRKLSLLLYVVNIQAARSGCWSVFRTSQRSPWHTSRNHMQPHIFQASPWWRGWRGLHWKRSSTFSTFSK